MKRQPVPHTRLFRALALIAVAAAPLTGALDAQQPPAADAATRPSFEVASIKPNKSADQGASFRAQPGGRVIVTNNTLRNIVRNTYQLQNFQIVGGQDWINSDRWDIVAKAEGEATPQQITLMMRTLLADRFKLVVHNETREMPIYALVLARPDGRLGPAIRPAAVDCVALMNAARTGSDARRVLETAPGARPSCGIRTGPGTVIAGGTALADFTRNLSGFAGRSVVDKTGLTGRFDFELTWTPDQLPGAPVDGGVPRPPADGPSLFTAMQEQLGFKLEAQRGPIDVLVIDSAERPTED